MKKKIFLLFIGLRLLIHLEAQVPDDCGSLQIGQKIPLLTKLPVINSPLAEINLSALRGKNIILDFWFTSCTACVGEFPKLESLQKEFRNDLTIMLVDPYETKERVIKFYATWKAEKGRPLMFPCILDKRLLEYFSVRVAPHYVWIGKDGNVKAITDQKSVTEANVRSFIKGEPLKLPVKWDMDQNKPIYASSRMPEDRMQWYSVFIQGRIDGGAGYRARYHNGKERGIAFTNLPVLEMYKRALSRIAEGSDLYFNPKRMILEIKDSLRLTGVDSRTPDEYYPESLCTFDLILPPGKTDSLYYYAWNDLNRLSTYRASVQRRNVKCFALTLKGDSNRISSTSRDTVDQLAYDQSVGRNIPVSALVLQLNQQSVIPLYVVDETDLKGTIDIAFPDRFSDFVTIQRQLRRYNLELIEVKRELEMFVLADN